MKVGNEREPVSSAPQRRPRRREEKERDVADTVGIETSTVPMKPTPTDIDALRIVKPTRSNQLRSEKPFLHHRQLTNTAPLKLHRAGIRVMLYTRVFVKSGDKSLALNSRKSGYDWISPKWITPACCLFIKPQPSNYGFDGFARFVIVVFRKYRNTTNQNTNSYPKLEK